MTGQTLLNMMEVLNQELQLQPGENDVTKGLLALNMAQDQFETIAAQQGLIFESATSTVTTSANTETTSFPAGCLRVDRLQTLDANSRPKAELINLKFPGRHRTSLSLWPYITNSATGEPVGYWTNGTSIYWNPLPSGTTTVRVYGFFVASDITASGTFSYPDIVSLPIASYAVLLLKMGLDDPTQDVTAVASEAFRTVLKTLSYGDRDGASPLVYSQYHSE